jgi:hypothetical protein
VFNRQPSQASKKMKPTAQLSGSHLRTYKRVFQHPISHNLDWRQVHELLKAVADVVEEPNGNLKATRNGQTLVLQPSHTKDVSESGMVMDLRHFLERSEAAAPEAGGSGAHWLVVIDHQKARIFRSEMRGAVPERIMPHEPDEYFRHAHHSRDFSRGQEKPDPNSFFSPVAKALQAPGPILIFGTGTGTGSEMEQFSEWLKIHHADLAGRVIGCVTVDERHLTENELLARAREFYAGARGCSPP